MVNIINLLDQLQTGGAGRTIAALRSVGAVTPESARDLRELGINTDDSLRRAVRQGRIRESTGGRYYVFEAPRASPRQRLIKRVVFFALIVLIPFVEFWLTARR
jgi:hypothetical protein